MYHFIYKTTCTINGKYYIGVHSSDTLEDSYLGSGKYLSSAIKKYGSDNFIREILYLFETPEEAFLKERQIVTEHFIDDPMTYNLGLGGRGGRVYGSRKGALNPNFGKQHTEHTKQKISKKLIGIVRSEETKNKIRYSKTGVRLIRKKITCPHCNKTGDPSAMYRWHYDNCKLAN